MVKLNNCNDTQFMYENPMNDYKNILQTYNRVTVVGISPKPERPSNWIARYLIEQGFDVIGVNPGKPNIPGIKVVGSLADIPDPLEIVDVFRSPESIPELVEELKIRKPKILWLQPGAQNPLAEEDARKSGMTVISGPCIFQEHRR